MPRIQAEKGSKKLLNAWAFYDWANSVYTLTIASSIFPIFYSALFTTPNQLVSAFGYQMKPTVLISIITAFTFLTVALLSPILSGIADYVGNKKVFMKFFCYVGSIGCIGLYWFSLEHIHISMLFYFMGLIGYWGSLVFYNSYLPDIAFEHQQDTISAKGFSLGYIGSVLLLVLNLAMVMNPQWFGFDIGTTEVSLNQAKIEAMKIAFITVGLWWVLFSQYTFYILPKGVSTGAKVTRNVVFNGLKELRTVWHFLKTNVRLKRYLGAFFVFSMAVQTIMLMAVYFGEKEINWATDAEKTTGLILSILVIQLVAVVGAFVTSRASAKFGNINTLIAVNFVWLCLCFYAFFMVSPMQFYIAASLVGLVMGGCSLWDAQPIPNFYQKQKILPLTLVFMMLQKKLGLLSEWSFLLW